jgi:hypothetical protein
MTNPHANPYDTDPILEAWKRQLDRGVRMLDAVVESGARVRAMQLSAAHDTHERICALEKSLAQAKSAQELCDLQWQWALASSERAAAYWRAWFKSMTDAGRALADCAQEGMRAAVAPPAEAAKQTA